MKTKTITTALLFLFSISPFAQKLIYKATKDLALKEEVDLTFSIDLDTKILNITFEDGDKDTYNIEKYEITKNEEDYLGIYPEGVKFTEYYITLEVEVFGVSYLTLNIPNQEKYLPTIVLSFTGTSQGDYYLVKKIN